MCCSREQFAMRPYRLRLAIAVWLGVIALGFNALVPIHLAFDLAHSLAPEDHDHGSEHGFVACLLSLVVGHDEDEDQSPSHKGHHHENCAVCGSISTLAGLAPVVAVLLAVPILVSAARSGSGRSRRTTRRSSRRLSLSRSTHRLVACLLKSSVRSRFAAPGSRRFLGEAQSMYPSSCRGIAAAAAVALLPGAEAMAHGFAGDRFFPATILTDDPFVANEMSLPTITLNPTQSDGSREFDVGPDLSMRITPDLGFTIGSDWARIRVPESPTITGWSGLHTALQYQLFINGPHEAMALAAVNVNWGQYWEPRGRARPTSQHCRRPSTSAKGSATCPNSLPWLRPFALTGNFSVDFPTKAESNRRPQPEQLQLRLRDRIQHSVSPERGQGHRSGATVQPPDPARRIRAEFAVQSRLQRGPPPARCSPA